VRDFSDSCRGKEAELEDIEDNRATYTILSSSLVFQSVAVSADRLTAEAEVGCEFSSRINATGAIERAAGDCRTTAVYEQRRWWLCESAFIPAEPLTAAMTAFFGTGTSVSPGSGRR
jgi:hypothetical protein